MKVVPLSQIADFINGHAFKPSDWGDKGLKIIRIQNLTDGNKPFNRTTKDVPDKYFIQKGDLLVSWSATLGVFEWKDDENALLNQHIFKVEPKLDIIDKSYFKYVLRYSLEKMLQFTHGSTMKHIVRGDFLNHQVPLPSLEEQGKIVKLLYQADALRQKRKQAIDLLDEYLKSVFLDMFGDIEKNPYGWEATELEKISVKITDGTHQSPKFVDEGIPFIFISNIINNEIDLNTKKFISENAYKNLTRRTPIEINDILYTTVGSYGNPAIVRTSDKFCFQRHIAHIKPDHKKINFYFLYGMLNSPSIKAQADRKARGIAQKTLNLADLKKFNIILPPRELQNKFAKLVQDTGVLKQKMLQQLDELEDHFQALMQKSLAL